jgi:hypothetical protein
MIDTSKVSPQWRANLIEQMGGSEVLADAHIRFTLEEAAKLRARHDELKAELRRLDIGLVEHLHDTAANLSPLKEDAERLRRQADAAYSRYENARIKAEADCWTLYRNRMREVSEELARPYSPVNAKLSDWKPGPQFNDHGSN